ncbi:MAG: RagB/SusD family nutrient uptake outer membrane protein [Bacteroidales bacterium]|nr:RagB/SusD family nutrient uptake outer membrane protein [Bacteroidales bacterium]
MKNIFKYTAFACVAGIALGNLTSCKEDFLETDQYELIGTDYLYQNDDHILQGLTGVYDMMVPNGDDGEKSNGDWGFKPNLFTGGHPSMDTQCTGWDAAFLSQSWNAQTTELNAGWLHAYMAITKCNTFLEGLEDLETGGETGRSEEVVKTAKGEATAVRGFFFTWLAQTFGRVPLLKTGETYSESPHKERAKDYEEMWNFIIDDFKAAVELLDWKPYNNQYGRATKGMALAYLADAYMWKAFRCPEQKQACLTEARTALKQILDKTDIYELSPSFTTNWDPAAVWNKECIWAEVLDEGSNWSNWSNWTSHMQIKWYVACIENGGWGSLLLPWEWYACYEPGDKRRDGSCVTGAVPESDLDKYGIEKSDYVYGYHPYLQSVIGNGGVTSTVNRFHCLANGEPGPSIWTTKLWRTAEADNAYNPWGNGTWAPTIIYWKRLPNVMLDYAECCFELDGENSTEGWEQLDKLRERAFGNLEVGKTKDLTDKFLPYYNDLAKMYGKPALTAYPLPFNDATVTVESAKSYYEKYAKGEAKENVHQKAFTSPVWKVAVNTERRKELNCEWSLTPDLHKSGFLADHIETTYPTDATSGEALFNYPWTHRSFTYSEAKMDMPIPSDELMKNPLCDQNPGY